MVTHSEEVEEEEKSMWKRKRLRENNGRSNK